MSLPEASPDVYGPGTQLGLSKHFPSSVDFGTWVPCLAISCTPAFRVAPSLYFPACGRDLPARNAPARRERIPSRVRSLWSRLLRPQRGYRRVRRLCRANTASPACQVSAGWRAPVAASPHALCPVGATQRRGDTQPQRCLAASWSQDETPLQLYPSARRQRRPAPAPGATQVFPDAGATLRRFPLRLAASAATQSSFRPWPGEPVRSRGTRQGEYR